MSDNDIVTECLSLGEIKRIQLAKNLEIKAKITPSKKCDIGMGPGKPLSTKVSGGEVGIIIDARGRPSWKTLNDDKERQKILIEWYNSLDLYPAKMMCEL